MLHAISSGESLSSYPMSPEEVHNKRILISPLNWGMGHVARCIPLIDQLLKQDNQIIVASDESQLKIFTKYFPNLETVIHEGYPFRFGEKGNFALDLAARFLALNKRLKDELKETEILVKKYSIDLVISDHRYGFRSNDVPSICLCHQLNLPVRALEGWVQRIHHGYLRRFTQIWVPDFHDSHLAGELSKNNVEFNVEYIGPLSRFSRYKDRPVKDIEELVIISGPLIYGEKFLNQIVSTPRKTSLTVIVSDTLYEKYDKSLTDQDKIALLSSKDWLVCDQTIMRAKKIISRSGYSTLMDLHYLGIPYDLSATPGQREQEYLLELWDK